jgi:6-pyruvoyltetrahydropterin/6-carboxytetrahydropterin synthase
MMKKSMRIFLEDSFDAAHWLPNVPVEHKCHSLHGHTYRIRLEVTGKVGLKTGWIIDYGDVKAAWETVKSSVDHRCLNEIIGMENSTCENLTYWIMDRLKPKLRGLCKIEIRETERCGVVLDC